MPQSLRLQPPAELGDSHHLSPGVSSRLEQILPEGAGGERRELEIRISDSGPGIPEELRERIFYPFFTTKERGSGVGLANAQKVILSHGGSIEVESGAGAGSTFCVRLPAGELS